MKNKITASPCFNKLFDPTTRQARILRKIVSQTMSKSRHARRLHGSGETCNKNYEYSNN